MRLTKLSHADPCIPETKVVLFYQGSSFRAASGLEMLASLGSNSAAVNTIFFNYLMYIIA